MRISVVMGVCEQSEEWGEAPLVNIYILATAYFKFCIKSIILSRLISLIEINYCHIGDQSTRIITSLIIFGYDSRVICHSFFYIIFNSAFKN